MAGPYYVDSTATAGDDTGGSWANAFETFAQAVTAATTANDIIYVSHAHSESLAADTTYTFGANVRVLCVNSGTGALATSAVIGAQSTNYVITIAGAYVVYFYGLIFRNGTGSTGKNITLLNTDGMHCEYEQCAIEIIGTGSGSRIAAGVGSSTQSAYLKLNNCTFKFGNTGNRFNWSGYIELINCTLSSAGSAPTILFTGANATHRLVATGCDFSHVGSGTLVDQSAGTGTANWIFSNCKFGSSMVVMSAVATIVNRGNSAVTCFNCDAGDAHYSFYHVDAFGETSVSNTIYANDGAAYDGTNRCSWKVVTTANCSYYYPYVSPWIDCYHSGTSAISPYLEILRSGSTTKYQNDEVWSEWSYQGTSGSTKATIVNDRMTPLGTAADQTASSLDASGWTGEDATNNAFMKLEAGSITPAEIGHLRARVCVGEPSITVYVDPTIRGRS